MSALENFAEILAQYRKFGWQLRQVLLTAEAKNNLDENAKSKFAETEIVESEVNAFWFSRPSGKENEAWELRLISASPYALFEVFTAEQTADERNDLKSDMEMRLIEFGFPKADFPLS